MSKAKRLLTAFAIILIIPCISYTATPEPPESPSDYITDLADILPSPTEASLNRYLLNLQQKTTAQIMILTILSLNGEDIEGFSMRIAEKWKPGKKGSDNGMLIVIALKDKKYRIEVGYGLESIIPDSVAGTLARQKLVPYFQKGDYAIGLTTLVHAIGKEIAQKYGVSVEGQQQISNKPFTKKFSILEIVGFIIVAITMIYLFIKHPDIFLLILMTSSRGGWSGGRGAGGGFGGGGGSFGGGGVSGRW